MRITFSIAAILGSALLSISPAMAHGGSNQDTVISDSGKIVVGTNGSCVRSKWQDSTDDCAPPAPEPEPMPEPVVQKPAVQPAQDARTVYFDFNKDDLTAQATGKLDDLVNWLSTAKGVTSATIYGYADQIGSPDYNQKLSARRAAAVEGYLASKGVVLPTSVEIVKGLGESNSLTSCDDKQKRSKLIECLAADRRVEIKFEILR